MAKSWRTSDRSGDNLGRTVTLAREDLLVDGQLAGCAAQEVELILRIRRARSQVLGEGLFSDPAWDILLQLYAAKLRRQTLALEDVTTDVPGSTLARWVAVLAGRGLIRCDVDPGAQPALRLALSESGELKMSRLLAKGRELAPRR
jgi:hypothetical protein